MCSEEFIPKESAKKVVCYSTTKSKGKEGLFVSRNFVASL